MTEKPRPKLLIVEDDLGLQRQLRWAYEDVEVFCAASRAEAIDLLRAEEPDVVTLDLGLPPDPDGTTEGFATLTEILTLKPDTKVIVESLLAGMTIAGEIKVGTRSVLSYFLYPVTRGLNESIREP